MDFEIRQIVINTIDSNEYEIIGMVEDDIWIKDPNNIERLFASKGELKIRPTKGLNDTYSYMPLSAIIRKW